jgi:hypothetical protein
MSAVIYRWSFVDLEAYAMSRKAFDNRMPTFFEKIFHVVSERIESEAGFDRLDQRVESLFREFYHELTSRIFGFSSDYFGYGCIRNHSLVDDAAVYFDEVAISEDVFIWDAMYEAFID